MRAFCEGCLLLIMVLAGLAFLASFVEDNPVLAVLGMGFSVVVFTLGLVGLALGEALGHIHRELRLLTERKRKRLEAERRLFYQAMAGKKRVRYEASLADRERQRRQRKTDCAHRREMRRGWWTRFWNGVRRDVARILGEENTILIGLVFRILRILACIAPFGVVAALAIMAWSLFFR